MLCLKLLITKGEFSRVLPCHVAVSTCLLVKATLCLKGHSGKLTLWEVDPVGVDLMGNDIWCELTSWEVDLVGLYLVGVDFVRTDFV